MKKLSLLIACFGMLSAAAVAQDGSKVKKTQEPVRMAPAEKTDKVDKVPAPEKKQPATSNGSIAPKTVTVKRSNMKRLPVKATKAQPAQAKAVDVK